MCVCVLFVHSVVYCLPGPDPVVYRGLSHQANKQHLDSHTYTHTHTIPHRQTQTLTSSHTLISPPHRHTHQPPTHTNPYRRHRATQRKPSYTITTADTLTVHTHLNIHAYDFFSSSRSRPGFHSEQKCCYYTKIDYYNQLSIAPSQYII